MIYDIELTDKLSDLPTETFDGRVFRATPVSRDATAPGHSGGRWSPPPQNGGPVVPVLYTSTERNGAIAEVASYWATLTPVPSKPLKVSQIAVSTSKTLRLKRADLSELGVDPAKYGERNYSRTQEIGAAINFLEFDGLIAMSARWNCDNLMIFTENHSVNEKLEVRAEEQVDWQIWAREAGFLE